MGHADGKPGYAHVSFDISSYVKRERKVMPAQYSEQDDGQEGFEISPHIDFRLNKPQASSPSSHDVNRAVSRSEPRAGFERQMAGPAQSSPGALPLTLTH